MATREMVRVKLTSSRCGHSYDTEGRFTGVFSQQIGEVVEMPADEAQRHIDRGLASAILPEKK